LLGAPVILSASCPWFWSKEAEDLVFVLDVNHDYQPWLVERARLFAAMDTWDGKKKRGLLLIE
jgi:Phytochelatin synthase